MEPGNAPNVKTKEAPEASGRLFLPHLQSARLVPRLGSSLASGRTTEVVDRSGRRTMVRIDAHFLRFRHAQFLHVLRGEERDATPPYQSRVGRAFIWGRTQTALAERISHSLAGECRSMRRWEILPVLMHAVIPSGHILHMLVLCSSLARA